MVARLLLLVAFAALPAFGVTWVGAALADRWGVAIGREMAGVALHLRPAPTVPELSAPDSHFPEPQPLSKTSANARVAPSKRKGVRMRQSASPLAQLGVFVPAATVLRLAQASAVPRAVAVGREGARPAGLRLIGVSALGIGMRDGDVITRVLGARVGAIGDVVSRVVAARAQRAREISGEFWRDGRQGSIVVEQPYLGEASSHVLP